MRITDIYHDRPRLGEEWASSIRHAMIEMLDGAVEGPIFSVPFGDKLYTFPTCERDDKGRVISAPFIGWSPKAKEFLAARGLLAEPGTLPITATCNGFDVPSAAALITGQGNVGKTPFSHALADLIAQNDADGFHLLRYGEPFCGYAKTEEEAGLELAHAMARHRVVVIDSVKDLLTDMSGSAMESGLARRALSMFSRLSMVASELGCTVILPVNPSSNKETVVDLLAEVAKSNVGVAAVNTGGQWSFISRVGEGKLRISGTADLSYDKGVPGLKIRAVINNGDDAEVTKPIEAFKAEAAISIVDVLGAARRLANQSN